MFSLDYANNELCSWRKRKLQKNSWWKAANSKS